MKKFVLSGMLLASSILSATDSSIFTEEFIQYHVNVGMHEVEDPDLYRLINENVKNLEHKGASNQAANELINLIEEGFKIDSFNMALLIETLNYKDASNNALKVILKAIEYHNFITSDHVRLLIDLLDHVNAANNATTVLLKAIEHGVPFSVKDRLHLADLSKHANAKGHVEKVRKALHERELRNPD